MNKAWRWERFTCQKKPLWLGHRVRERKEDKAPKSLLKERKEENWPQTPFPGCTMDNLECPAKELRLILLALGIHRK